MIFKLRKETHGHHTHIDVFVGPDKDHLALSGCLVLRHDEAKEVEYALAVPHKVCSCGQVYSVESWKELRYLGPQLTYDGDGKPLTLELRICASCGTTLACVERK